ncbi:hypothetical protein ACFP6B_01870 [Rothia nasimurium]|uniref:hypothetical protein n=1 Tax=Rothia nasimurium TaxID=85336 RepID=UPI0036170326
MTTPTTTATSTATSMHLNHEEALRLHSELRGGIYCTGASMLPVLAYRARTWETLGYESFEDYLECEFASLNLTPRLEKQAEAIAFYASYGMSIQAIAMITGLEEERVVALAGR